MFIYFKFTNFHLCYKILCVTYACPGMHLGYFITFVELGHAFWHAEAEWMLPGKTLKAAYVWMLLILFYNWLVMQITRTQTMLCFETITLKYLETDYQQML